MGSPTLFLHHAVHFFHKFFGCCAPDTGKQNHTHSHTHTCKHIWRKMRQCVCVCASVWWCARIPTLNLTSGICTSSSASCTSATVWMPKLGPNRLYYIDEMDPFRMHTYIYVRHICTYTIYIYVHIHMYIIWVSGLVRSCRAKQFLFIHSLRKAFCWPSCRPTI